MSEYTTFDIKKGFKTPRSNIQQYIDRGIIKPSIQVATRTGEKNIFSHEDLYRLRLIMILSQSFVSQKQAAEIAKRIRWQFLKYKSWVLIYRQGNEIKMEYVDAIEPDGKYLLSKALSLGKAESAGFFFAVNLKREVIEFVDANMKA